MHDRGLLMIQRCAMSWQCKQYANYACFVICLAGKLLRKLRLHAFVVELSKCGLDQELRV